MKNLSLNLVHIIVGIVTIAAVVILATSNKVSGNEALTVITGLAGVLLGGSTASMAANQTATAMTNAANTPAAPVTGATPTA